MTTGSRLRCCCALVALAVLGLASKPARADGMQCGNRLVTSGDSLYQVRSTCGDPDDARQRIEYRTVRVPGPCVQENGHRRCETERTIEVVIDEWVYDFGKNRFIEYLCFEQGELVRVNEGSYGRKD